MIKKTFILFIVSYFTLLSQTNEIWQNYTNMTNVKDAVIINEGIWAYTEGGTFYFRFVDKAYVKLDKAFGLSKLNTSALGIDKYGRIWLGTDDGFIDVYDQEKISFTRILDIAKSDKGRKKINQIAVRGDTAFVATDFGLSLIDINRFIFLDTFLKFGEFPAETPVKNITLDDKVIVSTSAGVAVQKYDDLRIAPESWFTYNQNDGLKTDEILEIVKYENRFISATADGLSMLNNNNWTSFIPYLDTMEITDIFSDNVNFFVIADNKFLEYKNSQLNEVFFRPAVKLNKIVAVYDQLIYMATDSGIYRYDFTKIDKISPDGPSSNLFPSLVVDNEGSLYSASGNDISGVGFYKLSDGIWKNYNRNNTDSIKSDAYYRAFIADNQVYLVNYGNGFSIINNDSIKYFDTKNTPLLGITRDPNFLVITGIASDSKNNVWFLNYESADQNIISVKTPTGQWYSFRNRISPTAVISNGLIIDQYDTKWFYYSEFSSGSRGLYYFNDNSTLENTSDDIWGTISVTDGLNNNLINCIALDLRGELWVGTPNGINIISNPNVPKSRISSVFALRQQFITTITVDALNRKWVGTKQGVFVMSADGTSLIHHYNTSNSPLITDDIKSIAIDNKNGVVYIGSNFGLASVTTTAIEPNVDLSELSVYPNPIRIVENGELQIKIDGLIRDSIIKIFSISGNLINEFPSPGGRLAFWNGRDKNGEIVNSGIYIVVAYDEEGNNVASTKLAVIRQ